MKRQTLVDVTNELERAQRKFGPFRSSHEGLSVVREEYKELEEAVFLKSKGVVEQHKEAIQLAAMALRFVEDVCDGKMPNDVPVVTPSLGLVAKSAMPDLWARESGMAREKTDA